MKDHYTNDIRLKKPSMALKADYENSRSAAIHLMCLSCMEGTSSSVNECTDQVCPLWSYRKNGISKVTISCIPSKDTLERLKEDKTSDAKREQGRKLGEARKNNRI